MAVSKKTTKAKTVTKDIKEVKNQSVMAVSDTKRERKTPSRFSVALPPKVSRELVIPKGRGVALSAIPPINEEFTKRNTDDPTLMTLHHLAFGMAAKRVRVKSNLRQFCGVKFDAKLDRAKLEQRIRARSHAVLRGVCTLLHLSSGGSTAEIVGRIADFLERPVAPEKTEIKKRAAPKKEAEPKKAAPKKAAPKKAAPKKAAEPKKAAPKKAAPKKAAPKKAAEPKKAAPKKAAEPKKAAAKPKKENKAAAKK